MSDLCCSLLFISMQSAELSPENGNSFLNHLLSLCEQRSVSPSKAEKNTLKLVSCGMATHVKLFFTLLEGAE